MILESSRGVAEAIAFVRPHADADDRNAVHCLAALLGRHGRADEMIELLQQCGRGQEALDQVRAHPAAAEDRVVRLAAGILRGLGRTDEAIALLRPRAATSLTGAALAEMLLHRGEVDAAMAVVHGRNPPTPVPDPWASAPTE